MVGRVGLMVAMMVTGVLGSRWWSERQAPSTGSEIENDSGVTTNASLQGQLTRQHQVLAQLSARLAHLEDRERPSSKTKGAMSVLISPDETTAGHSPQPKMTPEQFREMIQAREAAAREQGMARLTSIEGRWSNEPVDSSWAERYEEDIRGALGSAEFESVSLTDVDCRSSLCKLEFSANGSIEPEDLNTSLVKLRPFQNTEFTTAGTKGDEAGQIVIYLSRPGSQGLAQFDASGS